MADNFYDKYGANDTDSLDEEDIPIFGKVEEDPNYIDPESVEDYTDIFGRKGRSSDGISPSARGFEDGGSYDPSEKGSRKHLIVAGGAIVAIIVAVMAIQSFGNFGSDGGESPDDQNEAAIEDVITPTEDLPIPSTLPESPNGGDSPWSDVSPGDVFEESGKGSTSSASGVIQYYNWAYYEKRDPEEAAKVFDAANGWSASDIEGPVSRVPRGAIVETETRATEDEGVYDVILRVSTPDEAQGDDDSTLSFYQRYVITHDDGRFWILDKRDLGRA